MVEKVVTERKFILTVRIAPRINLLCWDLLGALEIDRNCGMHGENLFSVQAFLKKMGTKHKGKAYLCYEQSLKIM